jgi:hypothetical protein
MCEPAATSNAREKRDVTQDAALRILLALDQPWCNMLAAQRVITDGCKRDVRQLPCTSTGAGQTCAAMFHNSTSHKRQAIPCTFDSAVGQDSRHNLYNTRNLAQDMFPWAVF